MQLGDGSELTDDDLSPAEREMVERMKRILEIAITIAATPDQIMPLARLLILAQTANEAAATHRAFEKLTKRT